MKFKSQSAWLLMAGLLLSLSAAQAQEWATASDPIKGNVNLKGEIEVFSWAEPQYAVTLEAFNKLYPNVKVRFVTSGYGDAYTKLTTSLAANVPLADVVMMESERVATYGTRFPGAFLDLTQAASPYKLSFDRAKWIQSIAANKVIAMPTDAAPVALWYRTDFFEKAGVNAQKIRTWQDFIEAGTKVVAANTGVKMASIDLNGETYLRMMMQQQGDFYFSVQGKISTNSPRMKLALNTLKKGWDEGIFLNINGTDGLLGAMKGNKIATMVLPVFVGQFIKGIAPEQKGKWGVVTMPAFTKGGSRSAAIGGSTLLISSQSKNKEASWAFVEWYTTVGSSIPLEKRGVWPAYLPALKSSAAISNEDPFFATPKYLQVFASVANKMRPFQYSSDYDKARQSVIVAQTSVLTGGVGVDVALKKATDDLANATGRQVVQR